MKSILKIYSDRPCKVYKDMEFAGTTNKEKPLIIEMGKGRYYLIFEDINSSDKRIEIDYNMEENDMEDLIRVSYSTNSISCENKTRFLNMEQMGSLKRYIKKYTANGNNQESFSILEPETYFEIPLKYDRVWHFHNGLAKVQLHEKYGYIDQSNNIVIPIVYDYASNNFSENVSCVGIYNNTLDTIKYGYIDAHNNPILDFQFDHPGDFIGNYAILSTRSNYFQCINKQGKYIIPYTYDKILFDENGLCIIRTAFRSEGNKMGCVNLKGEVVIPCIYSNVTRFCNGYFLVALYVEHSLLYGLLDNQGNTILPIEYDEITHKTATKAGKEYNLKELI